MHSSGDTCEMKVKIVANDGLFLLLLAVFIVSLLPQTQGAL